MPSKKPPKKPVAKPAGLASSGAARKLPVKKAAVTNKAKTKTAAGKGATKSKSQAGKSKKPPTSSKAASAGKKNGAATAKSAPKKGQASKSSEKGVLTKKSDSKGTSSKSSTAAAPAKAGKAKTSGTGSGSTAAKTSATNFGNLKTLGTGESTVAPKTLNLSQKATKQYTQNVGLLQSLLQAAADAETEARTLEIKYLDQDEKDAHPGLDSYSREIREFRNKKLSEFNKVTTSSFFSKSEGGVGHIPGFKNPYYGSGGYLNRGSGKYPVVGLREAYEEFLDCEEFDWNDSGGGHFDGTGFIDDDCEFSIVVALPGHRSNKFESSKESDGGPGSKPKKPLTKDQELDKMIERMFGFCSKAQLKKHKARIKNSSVQPAPPETDSTKKMQKNLSVLQAVGELGGWWRDIKEQWDVGTWVPPDLRGENDYLFLTDEGGDGNGNEVPWKRLVTGLWREGAKSMWMVMEYLKSQGITWKDVVDAKKVSRFCDRD